eukprot:scaffold830_cov377-Prasinococcus_capsulatus_cf.AAC.24
MSDAEGTAAMSAAAAAASRSGGRSAAHCCSPCCGVHQDARDRPNFKPWCARRPKHHRQCPSPAALRLLDCGSTSRPCLKRSGAPASPP